MLLTFRECQRWLMIIINSKHITTFAGSQDQKQGQFFACIVEFREQFFIEILDQK